MNKWAIDLAAPDFSQAGALEAGQQQKLAMYVCLKARVVAAWMAMMALPQQQAEAPIELALGIPRQRQDPLSLVDADAKLDLRALT